MSLIPSLCDRLWVFIIAVEEQSVYGVALTSVMVNKIQLTKAHEEDEKKMKKKKKN